MLDGRYDQAFADLYRKPRAKVENPPAQDPRQAVFGILGLAISLILLLKA